jgi:Holliday junction resolvase RusA-like endonuclease
MKPIVIEIPFAPISVNQAYRCFRGRSIKSKAYRDFTKLIEKTVPRATQTLTEPLELSIELHLKRSTVRDADNLLKTTQDFLQQLGYFKNDAQIIALHVYKYHARKDSTKIVISLA